MTGLELPSETVAAGPAPRFGSPVAGTRYAPPVPRTLPYATPATTPARPPAALRPVAWTLVGLYLAGFGLVVAAFGVLGSAGEATCVALGGLLRCGSRSP